MKKFVHLVWKNFALLQTTLTRKKRYAHSNADLVVIFFYVEKEVLGDMLCDKEQLNNFSFN